MFNLKNTMEPPISPQSATSVVAPKITPPFPHYMRDKRGLMRQEDGQTVYADGGGSSVEELREERRILVDFFKTGNIPSKYFMRDIHGQFERQNGGLVYADGGGSPEEIAKEKRIIEFLLEQKALASPLKPVGRIRGLVGKILGTAA